MEKDDKRIEDLVNKLMQADSLETAPADFTDKVMAKVEALSNSEVTVYKPLIPKYIWWLLAAGFATLVGNILLGKPSEGTSLVERYNLPDVSFNLFENVSLDVSNTLMYAIVFLAIMVTVQIPILKQYFNSRLSY
ncbi:hypothetical protein [Winogradskyella tangerina]|uniref:hypothetical protein n=1 Tax=Winogradskyella tangerina TaxID=2023240 RepID=UPI000DBE8AC0|nr:hypothetical protein [Winogradskyella tangerina]